MAYKNVIKFEANNWKVRALWSLRQLLYNLLSWNILVRLMIWLNLFLNPDFFYSGARFFQVFGQNQCLQTGLISFVAFSSWLLEDVIFQSFLFKRSVFGLYILRLLFVIAMLVSTFIVVSVFHYSTTFTTDLSEYFHLLKDFCLNRTSAYLFIVAIMIASVINFFKIIQQKVGLEKFWNYIIGDYRSPKEENRIFLFVDLVSSTKYAEQLGHEKYSLFIQECFKYLGILEIKYRAMQYQFVGDEVVLTWPAKKKNYLFAVQFFYEYMAILDEKASCFHEKFGLVPCFTGSINSGNIMVAEVGVIKSEIAFHGDVLNTAARIQKQCKNLEKQLLVTSEFAYSFQKENPTVRPEFVDTAHLSGKQNSVNIYTITIQPC